MTTSSNDKTLASFNLNLKETQFGTTFLLSTFQKKVIYEVKVFFNPLTK